VASVIYQGADVSLLFTVKDGTGALVAADEITLTIKAPDGSTATQTLGGGDFTNPSVGTYRAIVAAALPTTTTALYFWHAAIDITGPSGTETGVDQGSFTVTKNNTT
jgi:hypothetical protein